MRKDHLAGWIFVVIALFVWPQWVCAQDSLPQRKEPTARTCYSMAKGNTVRAIELPDSTEMVRWAIRAIMPKQTSAARVSLFLRVPNEGVLIRVIPPASGNVVTLDAGGLVFIGDDRCVTPLRK
jgi:hypothetical protein